MISTFKNSGKLIGFTLKQEKIMSSIWIVGITLFSVLLAAGMGNMFDDSARRALAITLNNPGIIAMMGPVYGADNYTVGAMYANTMFIWVAIAVAVMNIFLIIRHTRVDEENGCRELVSSLPVGRLASLNAVMTVAVIVNVIIGVLHAFGIYMMSIESMDLIGCVLYGSSLSAFGLVFAGITAVFCQIFSSSRSAIGCSISTLGIFYMLRAAGDIGNEALSFISPMGLMQRSQVFVENHFYTVFILLAEAIAFMVIAYLLNSVRDIGQGFIPTKPGRKYAKQSLLSPFGLSFRLIKNTMFTWLIVMFMLGASYGSILGDIETFVEKSELYQMIIGVNNEYSVPMMFVSMVNCIISLFCTVPILTAVLKIRNEEKDGRLDYVLCHPVSRKKYLLGFVVISFVSAILFQTASALGLYISGCAVLEEPIAIGFLLKASLVYLPALWIMIGITVLLIGVAPKFTNFVWGYFGFSFFVSFIGRSLDLPKWLTSLTPFTFVPQLPVDEINYIHLAIMTVIAVTLTTIGFVFYKRRDTTA